MGGEGKSNLAVEYAYRHADDYDLVWWIPADQTTSARAALAQLARQLGIPRSDDIKGTVEGVLHALRAGRPYDRWLLIYDNAWNPDLVLPLTPLSVDGPDLGPGRHVLVTSRDRAWERHAAVVDVDVFERPESIALLRRLVPHLSDAEADMLSERVGDLPLAVHQAAAWQVVTGGTVEDYLRLFDERLAELAAADPGGDLPGPLAAAVSLNLDRLRDEDAVTARLLDLWSVFDPEPVSCALLAAGDSTALPSELAAVLADETRLRDAMRDISRFSLARFDEESGTLQVHRLVRAILDRRLPEDVRAQARRHVHAILVAATPGEEPEVESTWERREEIRPHILPARVFDADTADVQRVGIDQAQYLYQSGSTKAAGAWRRSRWSGGGRGTARTRTRCSTSPAYWRTRCAPSETTGRPPISVRTTSLGPAGSSATTTSRRCSPPPGSGPTCASSANSAGRTRSISTPGSGCAWSGAVRRRHPARRQQSHARSEDPG